MDNQVELKDDQLEITGAGGMTVNITEIESLELVSELPELSGTGGFSLGLIKKGNFIRSIDQAKVRVIKNSDGKFIVFKYNDQDVYLSLSNSEQTMELYQGLSESYIKTSAK